MNALQIGLIAVGTLVVAVLFLWQWWQSRRARQPVQVAPPAPPAKPDQSPQSPRVSLRPSPIYVDGCGRCWRVDTARQSGA